MLLQCGLSPKSTGGRIALIHFFVSIGEHDNQVGAQFLLRFFGVPSYGAQLKMGQQQCATMNIQKLSYIFVFNCERSSNSMHSVSAFLFVCFSPLFCSCQRNKCLQLQSVEHCLLLFTVRPGDQLFFFKLKITSFTFYISSYYGTIATQKGITKERRSGGRCVAYLSMSLVDYGFALLTI